MGAQQSVLREQLERVRRPSPRIGGRRISTATSTTRGAERRHRDLVVRVDELDLVGHRAAAPPARVGLALAQRLRQRADRARRSGGWWSAPTTGESARPLEPGDEVGEHRTGLDGRELVGVADQDQTGVGTHGLEQAGHHRQRDHRGLVDHDHVVRQPVGAVVPEPDAAVGSPAEQPVQCRRRSARRAAAGRPRPARACRRRLVDGLLQPGRGLAGGSASAIRGRRPVAASCCSETRASRPATVVVLPVPGPPVRTSSTAGAGAGGASRCSSYPLVGEHPSEAGVAASARRPREASPHPGDQVVADLALLAPVAVEVEARALEAQHLLAHQRARGPPRPARWPGRARAGVSCVRTASASRLHRRAGSAARWRSSRGRRRSTRHGRRGRPARRRAGPVARPPRGSTAEPGRDVHVGHVQHLGLVEDPQQAGGAEGDPAVAWVPGRQRRRSRRPPPRVEHRRPGSVEQVGELDHHGGGRVPGEDAAGVAVDDRGVSGRTCPRT